ncbi:golgin subfamily A member [Schizosaccharomyces cryophilus OY26]|uniref:Golgin subfamily A member n=1 Tax=Schizosaccharomyces cryophilus (strain OY26 / ATCC MYA-4695 / CBS 11777 / NBRC 106824 / NRRL Y48691) TaxID=653667 RepID=S9X732_SCHCR|nr:golgin subfamily A member [Schizosaccharomyces cryophilus OY26]EPY49586.1 golgin subfamily A member [Schizosaccharomyces cryophilus OY26]
MGSRVNLKENETKENVPEEFEGIKPITSPKMEGPCTISIFTPSIRNVTKADEKAISNTNFITTNVYVNMFHGIINRSLKTKARTLGLPISFSKPASTKALYAQFPPICVHSRSSEVTKGFPLVYFPDDLSKHDVSDEDWKSFIHDINMACSFSEVALLGSGSLVGLVSLGVSRFIISYYIEKYVDNVRFPVVRGFIELWNKNFFHQRKIHVFFLNPDEVAEQKSRAIEMYQKQKGSTGVFSKMISKRQWNKQHHHISDSGHSRMLIVSFDSTGMPFVP